MKTWDWMQRLEVKLHGNNASDERKLVFGLREISTQGTQFILNGRLTFFLGKLLVCAADLANDLEHRLAARQLRASLLVYAASEGFNPKVEVAGLDIITAQP